MTVRLSGLFREFCQAEVSRKTTEFALSEARALKSPGQEAVAGVANGQGMEDDGGLLTGENVLSAMCGRCVRCLLTCARNVRRSDVANRQREGQNT